MGGGRSLSPAESEHLCAALRELLARYGTQKAVAARLSVTQQSISMVLGKESRGSYSLARAVARVLGRHVDVVLGAPTATTLLAAYWRDLDGWDDAVAEARRMFPRVSDAAWEWLGSLSGPELPGLPAGALAMIAGAYDQAEHAPASEELKRPARSGVQKKGAK